MKLTGLHVPTLHLGSTFLFWRSATLSLFSQVAYVFSKVEQLTQGPGPAASLSFTGSLQAPSLCLRSPWPPVGPSPADPNSALVSEHPVEKWFTRMVHLANSQGRAEGIVPRVQVAEGEQSQETDILQCGGSCGALRELWKPSRLSSGDPQPQSEVWWGGEGG